MATFKDLIVQSVIRCAQKIYASGGFVGNLEGTASNATNASTADKATTLNGLTASITELNRVQGVTSSIQNQLDNKALKSHTHAYAGSETAGGSASSAVKLDSSAGDSTTPVYFSGGKPVACTGLDLNTTGSAAKLTTKRTIDGVDFDGSSPIVHYGTCSTAGATAEKAVSISGFQLVTGARVLVKFTTNNTAGSPSLNVSSTGAKEIMYNNETPHLSDYFKNGEIYEFVYTGTYWEVVSGVVNRSRKWVKYNEDMIGNDNDGITFPDVGIIPYWEEMVIEASFGELNIWGTIHIVRAALANGGDKIYRTGYLMVDNNGGEISFTVSMNHVELEIAYRNGEDVTDEVTWRVFYR